MTHAGDRLHEADIAAAIIDHAHIAETGVLG
jgi:hypothetical protein